MTEENPDCFPADILDEITSVVGDPAATLISDTFGGQTIYFPKYPHADHQLVILLGPEQAATLCKHFSIGESGLRVLIPMGKSPARLAREIGLLIRQGLSAPKISEIAGVHTRTVYRHRARMRRSNGGGA